MVGGNKYITMYKSRLQIETSFDIYKNLFLGDRSYMQLQCDLESLTFINHICMLIYYKIYSLLLDHNFNS